MHMAIACCAGIVIVAILLVLAGGAIFIGAAILGALCTGCLWCCEKFRQARGTEHERTAVDEGILGGDRPSQGA